MILNVERAVSEAVRLDVLKILADALSQAQQLEAAVLRLHTSWRRLAGPHERLWVGRAASSTLHLRETLAAAL